MGSSWEGKSGRGREVRHTFFLFFRLFDRLVFGSDVGKPIRIFFRKQQEAGLDPQEGMRMWGGVEGLSVPYPTAQHADAQPGMWTCAPLTKDGGTFRENHGCSLPRTIKWC